MVNQINIFFLSFGIVQSALISFFLIRKRSQATNIYLILFLVVVGLQLLFKVATKAWVWENVRFAYQLSYSLPFLIGPLMYLFVRWRIDPFPFRLVQAFHFLPFILRFSNIFVDAVFDYDFFPSFYYFVLPWPSGELVSLLSYAAISWRLTANRSAQNIASEIRQFLLCVTLAEASIIIAIFFMVRNIQQFPDIRLLFVSLTVLIYWITYKLMLEPNVFAKISEVTAPALKVENTVKYANSGLKSDEANRIYERLVNAVWQDKIFLQSDLSIDMLAAQLGVVKHHLSRVINERFDKTYVEFANSWRLEEARSRLTDPKFNRDTISSIALDSGFNSVSSFNAMFKRHYHVTPRRFRNQYLEEKTA